ncbi:MAG: hypothetical protein ACM3SW_02835 [Actinomycetota bacterium]
MKNCRVTTAISALFLLAISLVLPSAAQDKGTNDQGKKSSSKSVGFILSADANEHDLGLPIYPGSRRHKDNADDSSALQMGLWGGGSGFKLVVLKLESTDAPQKVARFYHKPLSRYGTVVDCGKFIAGGSKGYNLNCENDHPVKGGYTLEVGSKEKMHVVAIEPNGNGSLISLVYVEAPKSGRDSD